MSEDAYEIVLVNNSLWPRCKSFAVWSCEGIFCDVSKGEGEKEKNKFIIFNYILESVMNHGDLYIYVIYISICGSTISL